MAGEPKNAFHWRDGPMPFAPQWDRVNPSKTPGRGIELPGSLPKTFDIKGRRVVPATTHYRGGALTPVLSASDADNVRTDPGQESDGSA